MSSRSVTEHGTVTLWDVEGGREMCQIEREPLTDRRTCFLIGRPLTGHLGPGRRLDQDLGPGGLEEVHLAKAEVEFKEAQASLEAKKAEVEALKKALDQVARNGVPQRGLRQGRGPVLRGRGELQKAQGEVLNPAKLYEALIDPAHARPCRGTTTTSEGRRLSQIPRPAGRRGYSMRVRRETIAQGEVKHAQADFRWPQRKAQIHATRRSGAARTPGPGRPSNRGSLTRPWTSLPQCCLSYIPPGPCEDGRDQAPFRRGEVNEARASARILLGAGPGDAEKREAVLRVHAETALRRAQTERDLAAAALDVFKAGLAGALANRDYHKKVTARMRQLVERKAVEQRLLDEAEGQESSAEAKVRLLQVDVEEAESELKAAEQKLQSAKSDPNAKLSPDDNASLQERIDYELRHDPKALLLLEDIKEFEENLRKVIRTKAHANQDPAVKEYANRLSELKKHYESLKEITRKMLRQRQLDPKGR